MWVVVKSFLAKTVLFRRILRPVESRAKLPFCKINVHVNKRVAAGYQGLAVKIFALSSFLNTRSLFPLRRASSAVAATVDDRPSDSYAAHTVSPLLLMRSPCGTLSIGTFTARVGFGSGLCPHVLLPWLSSVSYPYLLLVQDS